MERPGSARSRIRSLPSGRRVASLLSGCLAEALPSGRRVASLPSGSEGGRSLACGCWSWGGREEVFASLASASEGEGSGENAGGGEESGRAGGSQAVWVASSDASASQSYVCVYPMGVMMGMAGVGARGDWGFGGNGRGFAHGDGDWTDFCNSRVHSEPALKKTNR